MLTISQRDITVQNALNVIFSSLEQRSQRAIVLPPALALELALVLASASTNVKVLC